MVFETMANLDLALVLIVFLAFAQYAKLGKGLEKAMSWVAGAAFFALVAVSFELLYLGVAGWGATVAEIGWLVALFQVLSFIALLIGGLMGAYKLLK